VGSAPASGSSGGGGGAEYDGNARAGSAGRAGQIRISYKLPTTVTLSNLTQNYTGSPLTPTATTEPAGLPIVWTGTPQVAVGSYSVTATIDSETYSGSAIGTFVIQQSDPQVTVWPAASAIVCSQALSASSLTGGEASVPGSFAFADDSILPGAGIYSAAVIFTPTDMGNYNNVEGTVDVLVDVDVPETVGIVANGNVTVTVTFQGTPGAEYIIQATSDLTDPESWEDVSTEEADEEGKFSITESVVGVDQRFYRSAKP
jgi:hypothetical protein